jgi:hypothetical protein
MPEPRVWPQALPPPPPPTGPTGLIAADVNLAAACVVVLVRDGGELVHAVGDDDSLLLIRR